MKAPKTRKELMKTLYDELNYSPNSGKTIVSNDNNWEKLEQSLLNDKCIQTNHSLNKPEPEDDDSKCSDEDEN